ncbi:MAG: S41 family peptidase [Bacilli bacterium]
MTKKDIEIKLKKEPKTDIKVLKKEKVVKEDNKTIKNDVKEIKVLETKIETPLKVKKESKKIELGLFEIILFLISISLVVCLIGYIIGTKFKDNKKYIESDKEIQTFITEYNYILDNYYGDINKEELIGNAIKGMLGSLDEYSEFVGDETNSFSITLSGSYFGLGIGVSNDLSGNIIINKVYKDTPAAKAGLKENDVITKFNNMSLKNMKSSEIVKMIAETENITLTILRAGKENDFSLVKENIILKSVKSEMLDNNIGYITIDIFAQNTYQQFKTALRELEKQGMKSLIIDVRSNSGGHLTTVESMLSLFLDSSHIIYQTQTKDKNEKIYSKGAITKNYPIVILQNRASASASEILSATLKEEYKAYVIGETSYGKGTVQQLQTVNGIGQYKFTTKKWLTPQGNWINGKGITPDLEVLLTTEYFKNPTRENDNQFQMAINYLKNIK